MDRQKNNVTKMLITTIVAIAMCIGIWQLGTASWIHAKAMIAQHLLGYSWQATLEGSKRTRPWPWSDTWPVAKLTAPRHDIEHIVLAGDSGSSLAFAPGYAFSSSPPNTTGITIISAHRDTHFNFLKNIRKKDKIHLQSQDKTIIYEVTAMHVVDSKTFSIETDIDKTGLLLVTCYPFESISAGGTLRYLVYATEVLKGSKRRSKPYLSRRL